MKTKEKLLADINKISSEVDDLYFELKIDDGSDNSVFSNCALKALYNYTSIRKLRILKKFAQGELDRAREMKDET
ncbi:hypothetical protein N9M26_01065 [Alphaproteobacteria bacterium]|nr:hypothetical protein [Alphaproteobacteria bacterium]